MCSSINTTCPNNMKSHIPPPFPGCSTFDAAVCVCLFGSLRTKGERCSAASPPQSHNKAWVRDCKVLLCEGKQKRGIIRLPKNITADEQTHIQSTHTLIHLSDWTTTPSKPIKFLLPTATPYVYARPKPILLSDWLFLQSWSTAPSPPSCFPFCPAPPSPQIKWHRQKQKAYFCFSAVKAYPQKHLAFFLFSLNANISVSYMPWKGQGYVCGRGEEEEMHGALLPCTLSMLLG